MFKDIFSMLSTQLIPLYHLLESFSSSMFSWQNFRFHSLCCSLCMWKLFSITWKWEFASLHPSYSSWTNTYLIPWWTYCIAAVCGTRSGGWPRIKMAFCSLQRWPFYTSWPYFSVGISSASMSSGAPPSVPSSSFSSRAFSMFHVCISNLFSFPKPLAFFFCSLQWF